MTEARPAFSSIFMRFADDLSRRSTCSRRKVGCVIASGDHRYVYGVGYNGNATGLDNGCDRPDESGNCGCLHAEDNAVINCNTPRSVDKVVYVTVLPCMMCAKRIINLGGVKAVYYAGDYHSIRSIGVLGMAEIFVNRMPRETWEE